jgi:hypothetical protein|tara:strand:- start:114 stop:698 length:585 start_codon:yes stop_codon:yes gene_type:complete
MSLWGSSSSDESKPKNLTTADKAEVYANESGWVVRAGSKLTGNGNTSATPEVLVTIGGLGTALAAASISSTQFDISEFDVSAGGTLSATVNYNEQVTVVGSPTIVVTNSQAGGGSAATLTLTKSAATANAITFTLVVGAAGSTISADDVLSIGAQNVALAGGTIKDTAAATDTNALVAISAGAGSIAGTITAIA